MYTSSLKEGQFKILATLFHRLGLNQASMSLLINEKILALFLAKNHLDEK